LKSLGVGADTLVGLCVERSLEAIVGILGILKAGGAYVPLDPAYPAERIAFMLEDSGTTVVLTATTDHRPPTTDHRPTTDHDRSVTWSPGHLVTLSPAQAAVVDLYADWPAIPRQPTHSANSTVSAEQRAYVIYTSGSTGRPKGVMVMQRGLLNLVYGLRGFFDDPAVEQVALLTSFSFDISVNQVFPTLLFGRTLH